MGENTPIDDTEEYQILNEEFVNEPMTSDKYFFEIFDTISDDIVSDEYFEKNSELFNVISEMFFDINERSGGMPPAVARRVLEGIISNILKFGLR